MNMMKGVIAAVAAVLILGAAALAAAEQGGGVTAGAQLLEPVGAKGTVNWSEGFIDAVGIGSPPARYIGTPQARPNALRAAQIDAYRNLLEVVNGVRVDSATLVRDFTVESDVVSTRVQGVVKGAQVQKQEYLSDGTVEVTVRMPIAGNFSALIIPKAQEKRPAAPPVPVPVPGGSAPVGEPYTGLVVDARGIQARPAMSPRIIDESGREIYGSMNVEREYAVQQGMSGYARDLTAAQGNPRVTSNPLSVKGIRTEGAGRSDIVIANADAEKIRAGEGAGFLKKCRVMIVLD